MAFQMDFYGNETTDALDQSERQRNQSALRFAGDAIKKYGEAQATKKMAPIAAARAMPSAGSGGPNWGKLAGAVGEIAGGLFNAGPASNSLLSKAYSTSRRASTIHGHFADHGIQSKRFWPDRLL